MLRRIDESFFSKNGYLMMWRLLYGKKLINNAHNKKIERAFYEKN